MFYAIKSVAVHQGMPRVDFIIHCKHFSRGCGFMKAWHDAMDSGAKRRPEQSGGKPKGKYHMLKIAFANLGGMILKKFPEDDHDIFFPARY